MEIIDSPEKQKDTLECAAARWKMSELIPA